MSKRSDKFFNDRYDHLQALPESILLDLARNEACPLEYRLTAVEIMRSKGFSKVNHPDLAQLLAHVEEEKEQYGASKKAHFVPKIDPILPVMADPLADNTQHTVRASLEKPVSPSISGIPSASVTTATMFGHFENPENGQ